MSITISSIRCSLQVALLGAVTHNLRAVNICVKDDQLIEIYFYYEFPPSEEEEEISEVIASEVLSDYIDVLTQVHRCVIPISKPIPEIGIRVFHRRDHVPN